MNITDTHTHLYSNQFDADRTAMMRRAIDGGVTMMLLPNIDVNSFQPMWDLHQAFPENTQVMMGIHPCEIPPNPVELMEWVRDEARTGKYVGIGEIGLDFYWDKTRIPQQEESFIYQCKLAWELGLGVSIHSRDATTRALELLEKENLPNLKGVFHCFSGSLEEGKRVVDLGLKLGIGGVVTYKNTNLRETLTHFSPTDLVLETDAPYLPPVPYRGQRNEAVYIREIALAVGQVYGLSMLEIGSITTATAYNVFSFKKELDLF